MEPLTCLIFTATEWKGERSGATFVWAQELESNRAWYFPVALTNEPEEDIENLPPSVLRYFQRLPAAHHRSDVVHPRHWFALAPASSLGGLAGALDVWAALTASAAQ